MLDTLDVMSSADLLILLCLLNLNSISNTKYNNEKNNVYYSDELTQLQLFRKIYNILQ